MGLAPTGRTELALAGPEGLAPTMEIAPSGPTGLASTMGLVPTGTTGLTPTMGINRATFSLAYVEGVGLLKVIFFLRKKLG